MSLIGSLINRMFTSADTKRDQGLQTPGDVERRDNLSYGPHGQENLLDVYFPKQHAGALPVIVSIHGGGWVYGTKEVYQFYCMSLAQRGFALVNFNYRLAPGSKFPAPLEDLNRVIAWIYAHAGEYPFDLQRICFVGDSAGANIATLYTSLCTNPDYARRFPFQPPAGFAPKAVALNCGLYDPRRQKQPYRFLLGGLVNDYLGKRHSPQDLEQINACAYLTADFPPTYLMTAEYDFVRSQAPLMEEQLRSHGIAYQYKIYGAGNKEIGHDFQCNIRLAEAQLCNDEECAFFRSHCGLEERQI